jgi:hypothetical protein
MPAKTLITLKKSVTYSAPAIPNTTIMIIAINSRKQLGPLKSMLATITRPDGTQKRYVKECENLTDSAILDFVEGSVKLAGVNAVNTLKPPQRAVLTAMTFYQDANDARRTCDMIDAAE